MWSLHNMKQMILIFFFCGMTLNVISISPPILTKEVNDLCLNPFSKIPRDSTTENRISAVPTLPTPEEMAELRSEWLRIASQLGGKEYRRNINPEVFALLATIGFNGFFIHQGGLENWLLGNWLLVTGVIVSLNFLKGENLLSDIVTEIKYQLFLWLSKSKTAFFRWLAIHGFCKIQDDMVKLDVVQALLDDEEKVRSVAWEEVLKRKWRPDDPDLQHMIGRRQREQSPQRNSSNFSHRLSLEFAL